MMKKLILFLSVTFLFYSPIELFGQQVSFCYKSSWSRWKGVYKSTDKLSTFSYPETKISKYTNGLGYSLETEGGITFFEFKITNYIPPTKEEKEEHWDTNEWYTYEGTVSYYVSDEYPTAEDLAKSSCFVLPDPRLDVQPKVKRTTNATIKIAPYKNNPEDFNIWFDDIGVGLNVTGLHFKGDKKYKHKGRLATNLSLTILFPPLGIVLWFANPVYDY